MITKSIFFLIFILSILAIDKVFMSRKAKKAWQMMAITYSTAIFLILFPNILSRFAEILGIGRGVDLVFYLVSLIVVREIFLSRSRQNIVERNITILARQIAIKNPQVLGVLDNNNVNKFEG